MKKKGSRSIKKAAAKTVKTVKNVAETVVEKAPEFIDTVADKAEDIIKNPQVEETLEKIEETVKETTEKVARTVCTRISDITFEIFETNVSLDAVEKAVKEDAANKNLKGEIKIYINAERRAAYYTVNGEGTETYKVDLTSL